MTARRGPADRVAAIALLAALSGCAGPRHDAKVEVKVKAPVPAPICAMDGATGNGLPARDRQFTPGYWFTLLLRGYRTAGVVPRPAADCTGRPVAVDSDGCSGEAPPKVTSLERATAQDLLVVSASDTTRLVWAMIDRVADGEVQGPVGLVEITDRGLKVLAIGVLRAYPERATLRLLRLGSGSVLVAEGEHCEDRASLEHCPRAIRFLSLAGDRFVPLTLNDDKGVCLGRAFVTLAAAGTDPTSRESYRLETSVSFAPEEVVLHEQLTISAEKASANGFLRVVRSDRHLGLGAPGRLVASGPALVARWLEQSRRGTREKPGPVGPR